MDLALYGPAVILVVPILEQKVFRNLYSKPIMGLQFLENIRYHKLPLILDIDDASV